MLQPNGIQFMANDFETRTAHFELRDFLFYLVPGGVVLLALLVLCEFDLGRIIGFDGIVLSLVAVFLAYFSGQVVYPLSYPLRQLFSPGRTWVEDLVTFPDAHKSLIQCNANFYLALVFRDRTLARFAIAMVTPTMFLTVALVLHLARRGTPCYCLAIALLLGALAAYGFIRRFRHYDHRYRRQVLGDPQQQATEGPAS